MLSKSGAFASIRVHLSGPSDESSIIFVHFFFESVVFLIDEIFSKSDVVSWIFGHGFSGQLHDVLHVIRDTEDKMRADNNNRDFFLNCPELFPKITVFILREKSSVKSI